MLLLKERERAVSNSIMTIVQSMMQWLGYAPIENTCVVYPLCMHQTSKCPEACIFNRCNGITGLWNQ